MTTRDWLRKITLGTNWRFLNMDVLFLVFFSVPIVLLYVFVPSSFEVSWKGRIYYVLFIWLVILEIFLSRHKLPKFDIMVELRQVNVRFVSGLIVFLVPTVFTVWQFMSGGRDLVIVLGGLVGATFPDVDWPVAFESIVFAFSFILSVWLLQNRNGLGRFKVSLFFIGAVATFFMVDTFYHYGTVWFLQLLVPPITFTAAFFLNVLGYPSATAIHADGSVLFVRKVGGHGMNLLVYWPCAGVQSVFIYTMVFLLLFKNTVVSTKRRIVYLAIGAIGTFMANILRIVSISLIGTNTGPEAFRMFHEYYGELLFVAWIIVYFVAVSLYESHHKTE